MTTLVSKTICSTYEILSSSRSISAADEPLRVTLASIDWWMSSNETSFELANIAARKRLFRFSASDIFSNGPAI